MAEFTNTYYWVDLGGGNRGGGYYQATDLVSYIVAHDKANADNVLYGANDLYMTQYTWLGHYMVDRGILFINTSAMPSPVLIKSAKFKMYCTSEHHDNDWYITAVDGDELTYPTPHVSDYGDLLDETTDLGKILCSTLTAPGWNEWNLTSAGLNQINPGGITRFAFRSSRDISSTPPIDGDLESAQFGNNGAANGIQLTVTYEYPKPAAGGNLAQQMYAAGLI